MPAGDDFKKTEEEVLEFWEKNYVFEKGLERRKKAKRFVFFEGPPTANGRPGVHHLIGRAFKDLFNRYKTMRGFYVERRSGWDTHGLPVEIEVEKSLGLKSKKEIEEYGIAKFNRQAKQSVWKYKEEWERFTKRIGFWIDLKNPYITYEPKYIESLWHIFKKIWEKKLLFKGYKVVPFCTRCGTPLSSHEVAQGYKEISDNSVYVKFKIKSGQFKDIYLLVWTTTPWTLPGNVALAVGKDIDYVTVENGNEKYIVAKDRLLKIKSILFGGDSAVDLNADVFLNHSITNQSGETITVGNSFKGEKLINSEYEPLFEIPFLKSEKSYRVYPADFVTTSEGTGIVHTAVMYGEDDHRLGKEFGLPQHHTVDKTGLFTNEVPGLAGKPAKDKKTDAEIIEYLRSKNLLFKEEKYTHDYPFCWRCGNPLLYYATDSWFIRMSKLEKALSNNNQKINWHPTHLKDGRFGEWLKGVKDWAISRDRYWGTPLPIWECQSCQLPLAVGFLEELEKKHYRIKNTFYILRHGLSAKNIGFNREELVSSKLEHDKYDLVPEGIKQMEKSAKQMKKNGGLDMIFTSPFLRAKHSAEIVAKKLGLEVVIDERLKEIDYGSICEGRPLDFCEASQIEDFEVKRNDGESWNDIRRRMFSLVQEINQKYEGKKILLVSHGDPLWLLRGIIENLSEEEMLARRTELYTLKGEIKKLDFLNYPYNEKGELDLHRPYIDAIILKCAKCGGPAKRISEVADVWFDSGAMPYAQWHYPFENKDRFKQNFPADFVAEGIDQTRGWFYTLLAVSTLLGDGPAYKNVLSYGHVLDEKGQKMSKSKGNAVNPWTVIDQYGADAARWYFYTVNNPGEPKFFSLNEVGQRLRGFVMTLWNTFRFFELYNSEQQVFSGNFHHKLPQHDLDRWMLSRLHQTVKSVTEAMDNFDSLSASRAIEQFVVDDFSKWWLRRSRTRLKENLSFFRFLLLEICKLIAPFTPFVAEKIHQELHRGRSGTESVHWHDWPEFNKKFVDLKLEEQMDWAQKISTAGLALRKKASLRVRQPLRRFKTEMGVGVKFSQEVIDLIKDELNIKEIVWEKGPDELDLHIDDALKYEGWAREIARQVQDMRKEAGYKFTEKVVARWHTDDEELKKAISQWGEFIAQNSLLKEFAQHPHNEPKNFDIQKEFELETGRQLWLGVKS